MSKQRPQLGRRIDSLATSAENSDATGERSDVSPASPSDSPSPSPPPKPGRPPGAKNRDYVSGERFPGMCPKCRCTEATSESRRTILLPNDPEFTHVVLIRCACKKCKQWRIDRQKCNPAE